MKRILLYTFLALVAIVVLGMLIPQNLKMPVVGADNNSYNHETAHALMTWLFGH